MKDLLNAYRQAFRLWIRRRTRPLSIEEAEEKRLFWAKIYAITSLGVLCLATYNIGKYKYNFPIREDLPKNIATAVALTGGNSVRFISFDGIKKTEDFTLTKEEMAELKESNSLSSPRTKGHKDSTTI